VRSLIAALLAAATVAVWAPGFAGPYHYDDFVTPVGDPASASIGAFAREVRGTLRPVTKLTYAVEASLGLADHPGARRAVSAVFHAGAAVALMLLLVELVPGLGLAAAALLALLWAAHPVQAEAVLALAGRPAALSTALLLFGLLAYAREHRFTAAILVGAAALARETALAGALPLLVLELRELRRRGGLGEHARNLWPAALALVGAAAWIVATPRVQTLVSFSFEGRPLAESIVQQVAAVPVGLSLYVRPGALSMDHGELLPIAPASPLFVLGIVLYLLAVVAAFSVRRAPLRAFGAALWLAAVLPTQSLVPKLDPLTERPLCLALAGLVFLLVRPRRAWIAALALAPALVVATVARAGLYRDDVALWRQAAANSAHNARPHVNYALQLLASGERDEARRELEAARAMEPDNPRAEVILEEEFP
jgi:protein O-mannosyl-transferase